MFFPSVWFPLSWDREGERSMLDGGIWNSEVTEVQGLFAFCRCQGMFRFSLLPVLSSPSHPVGPAAAQQLQEQLLLLAVFFLSQGDGDWSSKESGLGISAPSIL